MFNEENYRNILEEVIPFHKLLGTKLQDIREGYAAILIPFRPDLVGDPRTQRIHGGVTSFAMDAAGGAAGITTLYNSKDLISTIDIRVDYLAPGKLEDILAEGFIVKSGGSVIFTRMTARHPNSDELIAEGRGVYRVKRIE
ncbi:MAG TPA: hypothetical protein DCE41_11750 [Cytophagales bacterium]|nr:hypothetical protein [Cytophagales bacterium]